jgi:hypothetical protein
VKPDTNVVEIHPQLSHDGHPVDGAGSPLPSKPSEATAPSVHHPLEFGILSCVGLFVKLVMSEE